MNNSQNTTKQLSQEQIDSLNAVYAKMEDNSLVLEWYSPYGYWFEVKEELHQKIIFVIKDNYQYRIKPQPKMKTVIQVKEAQLPLPKEWRVSSIYNEVILSLPCHSSRDAETWQRFLASMMNNTIQVEDK